MMIILYKDLRRSIRGKTLWQIVFVTLFWIVWKVVVRNVVGFISLLSSF